MNQRHTYTLGLLVLVVALLLGCNSTSNAAENGGTDATLIPPVIETSNIVSAEAFVVPVRFVDVAFEIGGRVVDLTIEEGDQVQGGTVLARLDDTDVQASVTAAAAALAQAQANLDSVKAGATVEQIGVAEAAVRRAEANLESVKAGPTNEQMAMAEAALARAETNLAQVVTGATPEEIAIAQARVNTLQAQLNNVLSGARPEQIEASAAQLRQTEADLSLAQTEYDKVAYAADSEFAQPAAIALQKATLAYEAVRANHQALLNGVTPQEAAITRAQLAEGEAALQQVLSGARPEQIAMAQIGVMEAEANLEQVKAGATPEQIAVAEANVRQAEAALEQARLALSKTQLVAPFDGTVSNAYIEVGQFVSPGTPGVNLADLSVLRIETDDLTEIDVVKVIENQPVTVRVDAISDESFSGKVTRITPRSETKAGDVTYTVIIDLDDNNDPRLRWGMTTFVEIDAE